MKLTTHLHLVLDQECVGIHPFPQYAFMAWCSVKKRRHRDYLAFTFTFTIICNKVQVKSRNDPCEKASNQEPSNI
jgi:hypothetical protein